MKSMLVNGNLLKLTKKCGINYANSRKNIQKKKKSGILSSINSSSSSRNHSFLMFFIQNVSLAVLLVLITLNYSAVNCDHLTPAEQQQQPIASTFHSSSLSSSPSASRGHGLHGTGARSGRSRPSSSRSSPRCTASL